jgi:hypothetical protein
MEAQIPYNRVPIGQADLLRILRLTASVGELGKSRPVAAAELSFLISVNKKVRTLR